MYISRHSNSAHLKRRRHNFKDLSVQGYGDVMFSTESERACYIYDNLPPIVPSLFVNDNVVGVDGSDNSSDDDSAVSRTRGVGNGVVSKGASRGISGGVRGGVRGGGSGRFLSPPVLSPEPVSSQWFSQSFNNSSNGCFAGESAVDMADGTTKCVKDLVKGDKLATLPQDTLGYMAPVVVCVIRMDCKDGIENMVSLRGGALLITAFHPVFVEGVSAEGDAEGKWMFPSELAEPWSVPCDSVFNVVLDYRHTMMIGGMLVPTLGHGFTKGILAHPYFGTNKVIRDLQGMHGYGRGVLHFGYGSVARSGDGTVIGFQKSKLLRTSKYTTILLENVVACLKKMLAWIGIPFA